MSDKCAPAAKSIYLPACLCVCVSVCLYVCHKPLLPLLNKIFLKNLSGTLSERQTVQTVCKYYQKRTKVTASKESKFHILVQVKRFHYFCNQVYDHSVLFP